MTSNTPPNIVVVVIDTLRLDEIEQLKSSLPDFTPYSNVVSTSPWTLPSHVSLFTGLYPSEHGAHETFEVKCDEITAIRNKVPTFLFDLTKLGYNSLGFSSNIFVSPTFGFNGFGKFENWRIGWPQVLERLPQDQKDRLRRFLHSKNARDGIPLLWSSIRNDPDTLVRIGRSLGTLFRNGVSPHWPEEKGGKEAVAFVRTHIPSEPFFIFVNFLEAHEPYFRSDNLVSGLSPFPAYAYNQRVVARWVAGYRSQVPIVLQRILRLLSDLDSLNMLENTCVIVTSDHGQLLGEHGLLGHGVFLFDELVRIPLLIRFPKDVRGVTVQSSCMSSRNIKHLVLSLARGETRPTIADEQDVFAESWGVFEKVHPKRQKFAENMNPSIDGRRVCVYSQGSNVSYNITKGLVEESRCYNGKPALSDSLLVEKCIHFAETHRKPHSERMELLGVDDAVIMDQLRRLGYV